MLVDPNYMQGLAASINQATLTQQNLTTELSSGLAISQLSDNPVAAANNVGLSASIAQLDSFSQTATSDQGMMQVADSTLGEVVTQVTAALSHAVSAGSGTMSAQDLTTLKGQLETIRDGIVALGNTSYQGQYLFAGSKGSTTPFTNDTSTDPATATYNGDTITQKVAAPNGQQIAVNVPGSNVFTNSSGNLLQTLNQLVSDVGAAAAGTGSSASITADTTALTSALSSVTSTRATLDSNLSQLTTASTYAQSQQTVFQAQQSTLLSADPATIATELKASETQQQALLAVTSALESQQTLFGYMK